MSSKAGRVPRFESIELQYMDEHGQVHKKVASGFYARVLQHEIDHLNGVLITERLTVNCVQGSLEEMMAMRRNELPKEKQLLFDALMDKKKRT